MHFDGHACVTTVETQPGDTPTVKQRSEESKRAILSMIAEMCSRDKGTGTAEQHGLVSAALADVRATMKQKTKSPLTPIVALYDLPEERLQPMVTPRDKPGFEGRPMDIAGSHLSVYRIHDDQLFPEGARFNSDQQALPRTHLLIFCVSIYTGHEECWERISAFHRLCGGDTTPLLVIVKDATTDEAAQQWWNECIDRLGKLQVVIRALPQTGNTEADNAVEKIQKTIKTRALQPLELEAAPCGCFAWLRGRKRQVKVASGGLGTATSIHLGEDALARAKVWVPRILH